MGQLESEFLDVGKTGMESDEVSLFAEGHVHLCHWIAGGTVEVELASDCVGGVGKKVAVDDRGLGVGDGAEIFEEFCREDVYVAGGNTSKTALQVLFRREQVVMNCILSVKACLKTRL